MELLDHVMAERLHFDFFDLLPTGGELQTSYAWHVQVLKRNAIINRLRPSTFWSAAHDVSEK